MLDGLDAALIELVRVLDLILADEAQTSLDSAAPAADDLANAVAEWPPIPGDAATEVEMAAANGLRDAAQAAIQTLEERLKSGTQHADSLRKTISESETQNAQALQTARDGLADLTGKIDQEKLRLDQAQQSHQALFDQAQAQRASEHQAASSQQATEARELVENTKQTFQTTTSEIEEKARADAEAAKKAAKEQVDSLTKLREQARDLVGVIGRTGMTGGYQQDAVAEEKAANRWRLITIGFATAAVVILGVAVIVATYVSTDASRLISKTLLAAALGGIATYAARQSAHHRANARNARNLELALASIGPYLEPLDEEKRKEVLEVFAYILFAQRPVSADKDAVEMGPTNLQTLIEAITKVRGG